MKHLADTRPTERIIHIFPPLLGGQQPTSLQLIQMAGNSGHIPPRVLMQLTHTTLPFQQHLNNQQTHGVPQRLEHLSKSLPIPNGKTQRTNI